MGDKLFLVAFAEAGPPSRRGKSLIATGRHEMATGVAWAHTVDSGIIYSNININWATERQQGAYCNGRLGLSYKLVGYVSALWLSHSSGRGRWVWYSV
jgi:hypothetical protein